MIDVISEEEERLDRIARRLYGTERGGTVEALLAANPGLAAFGPFIPQGTRLVVPSRPAPQSDPALTRPWE